MVLRLSAGLAPVRQNHITNRWHSGRSVDWRYIRLSTLCMDYRLGCSLRKDGNIALPTAVRRQKSIGMTVLLDTEACGTESFDAILR